MGFTLLKSSPFSTKALLSTTTKPTTLSRLLPLSSRLLTTAARTHFSFSSLKPILAASGSVQKSEEEWQAILSPEQFRILRQKGTEYPGTGEHDKFFEEGVYHCAGCGAPLYKSTTKFNSGCGWPAFYEGFPGAINRTPDPDGMRIEITCAACGGHLGHVFKGEGFPTPTDERHCVNSISLNLKDHALPCLVTDMDGRDDPILFPLHCCKIIHLLRHAQGIHNVENGDSDEAYLTPKYFDAELTPLGWQQVDNLRKHVCESGISKRIELVIVSPFLRALQTAAGVFGGDDNVDGSGGLPLMVSNSGNSGRPAISSLNCPTFIASELGRGRIGYFTCDKRGNISDYQILFPAIDFSLIESDEDILWKADTEETNEQLTARVQKFIRWLWTRQEKEIAVVTHGLFLKNALVTLGNYSHPSLQSDTQKRFENCELRSFIIVDRSMTGSGPSLGA